jgi:hypothetical protein
MIINFTELKLLSVARKILNSCSFYKTLTSEILVSNLCDVMKSQTNFKHYFLLKSDFF